MKLADFAKNIHSQNGEDGVLAELLNRLQIQKGWCVEVGAWDGKHLSNTFALIQKGWRGVYIEGDERRYKDLQETVKANPAIIPILAYVSPIQHDEHSLDKILGMTNIPQDFDILSIDVDSYDYWIWAFLSLYRPKVVIIEINGFIPVGVENIQSVTTPLFRTVKERLVAGASFTSMKHLGMAKGYSLVTSTGNLFFVRNDLMHHLNIHDANSDDLFDTRWLIPPFWKRVFRRIFRTIPMHQ